MANLLDLTAQLVSAHASNTQMTSDELYKEIENVFTSLKALESGAPVETPESQKQMTLKQAFKKDEVVCMICGKGGFKTLTRHIAQAHQLKPGQYRKLFSIPSSQSLTAKNYSDARRATALELNLGSGLEKARATRKANASKKAAPVPMVKTKASVPAVKVKAPVPAKTTKAQVPAVAKKADVPAKIGLKTTPVKVAKTKVVAPSKVRKMK